VAASRIWLRSMDEDGFDDDSSEFSAEMELISSARSFGGDCDRNDIGTSGYGVQVAEKERGDAHWTPPLEVNQEGYWRSFSTACCA
jgi:hypothetical protein